MTEIRHLRDTDLWYELPSWAEDEEGADGFEWRMYWLLGELAGAEACQAINAKSLAAHKFHQFREQLLDRVMLEIKRRLPPHSPFPDDPLGASLPSTPSDRE